MSAATRAENQDESVDQETPVEDFLGDCRRKREHDGEADGDGQIAANHVIA